MNIAKKRQTPLASALACAGLLLGAGQAAGAEYWLCAKAGSIAVPGEANPIPIWGYVLDSAGFGANCAGMPTLPGPMLTVPSADTTGLTIHLRNELPEPTSIVIPGQTVDTDMTPVWTDGNSGSRTSTTQRVRSFTHEALVGGGIADYFWPNIKPGTYLYHSGTHPQVQVQMGLYGALTKNFSDADSVTPAPAQAYAGVPYGAELTLLFSEIDPAQHAAIALGTSGAPGSFGDPLLATTCPDNNSQSAPRFLPMTSTLCYKPKYYLINGKPYPDSNAGLPTLSMGQDTLLRLLNAGLKSYVPTIQGTHMKMIAEDGNRYRYREGGVEYPRDQYQYSTLLASLKTTDAIVTPASLDGTVIYDRRLNLVNNLAQDGGMFLKFDAACTAGTCTDLAITKDDSATSVSTGDTVTYTIVVSNIGPSPVTGAQVTDVLPAALTGAIWNCTATTGTAACVVASGNGNVNTTVDLPVGASVTFTVSGTVATTASLVNTASVAVPAGMADPYPANNSATDTDTIVHRADLSVTKSDGVASVVAGGPVAYSIVVSNAGPDPVTGAMVTDTLPAAISGGAWTCGATPGSACAAAGGNGNIATTVDLAVDGAATFVVTGLVSQAATGTVVNTASVAVPNGVTELNTADNSATDTDTISLPPLYFSTAGNTAVPGTSAPYDNADIYYRGPVGDYTRVFDASAFGVPAAANVDAFVYNGSNDVYLSFSTALTLPGSINVQNADIVHWNGTAWRLYFDGSQVGLTTQGENVDAFALLADGSLLVSTSGNPSVAGLPAGTPTPHDEDLLRCVGTFWAATTCTWSLYFDSSDVALNTTNENVDFAKLVGGNLLLSTTGNFSAGYNPPGPPPPITLSGTGNQVFSCLSPTTGIASACAGFGNVLTLPSLPVGSIDAINLP